MKGLILVTGSTGMVGSRFIELFSRKNFLHYPTEVQLDITDKKQLEELFSKYKFSAIINFAAYTNVGEAENQKDDKNAACWKINVEGVRNLLSFISPVTTNFIQISTDMVFPGSKDDPGPYSENHPLVNDSKRVTWYGYSKGEAERVVRKKCGSNGTILRLIYPVRAKFPDKKDYLRRPLELYDQGKLYPLFTDQQVSLTFIDEACKALEKIINNNLRGIYHAGSPDTTTPYEIIGYLIEKARGKKNAVKDSSLDGFLKKVDNPVRYPKFGGLKVAKTQKKLGIKFSTTHEIVDKLVKQGISS